MSFYDLIPHFDLDSRSGPVILDERPSSRNSERRYKIIIWPDHEVTCDCPACEHNGTCFRREQVRAEIDSRRFLKRKAELSDIKLPNKQQLIQEQWDYHFMLKLARKF